MKPIVSYIDNLLSELDGIEKKMMDLLDISTIKEFHNDPYSGVAILAPTYYWGETDDKQKLLQMELNDEYAEWFSHLTLLFRNGTPEISDKIDSADKTIRSWINKESDWSIKATIQENKLLFKDQVHSLKLLLLMKQQGGIELLIAVPDTNAIIKAPDPIQYAEIMGCPKFEFVVTTTVLQELDKHKIHHRDREFRDKVESVIRRIKGWRTQGSLNKGVKVHNTITVKLIANEPDFTSTLGWLDPQVADDRIVASVLEIQRKYPHARIVLVTSDINLQNKAEKASIAFEEPPTVQ